MAVPTAYEEIVDFIAHRPDPEAVIAFRPSEASRRRVRTLLAHQDDDTLTPEQAEELTYYVHLEHIMRLAKARAREYMKSGRNAG